MHPNAELVKGYDKLIHRDGLIVNFWALDEKKECVYRSRQPIEVVALLPNSSADMRFCYTL